MLNERVILRHNRATADLTEHLLNCRYSLAADAIIPDVLVDCAVVTAMGEYLPIRITMCETDGEKKDGHKNWYSFEVCQLDREGQLHVLFVGDFEHSTMSAINAIMSAGHLCGDFIKFYFKGGK